MSETKETQTNTVETQAPVAVASTASATPKFAPRTTRRRPGASATGDARSGGGGGRRPSGPRRRPEREKPEFEQKIISIRRVTRVMAGGRRFSFSVAMLLGDKNGRVGFGIGKSNDTSLAISKAVQDAKKHMFSISRTKSMSIPHEVEAKFKSSRVWIAPNKSKGLVSGSAIRDIFNMAGMTDITAKIYSRSKNPINNVRATMRALAKLARKESVETVTNETPVNA